MIAALQHRAGEQIQDRYEVLSVLGSGAFGTVYRCRDHELDTVVAIKELHVLDDPASSNNARSSALEQFRREALHLSRLRHPHIVSGHYQPHNGTWLVCPICGFTFKGVRSCPQHNAPPLILKQRNYLVMEYLDGPNLAEAALQNGGVLPIAKTLKAIRQIAEALALIHERGWIHRDIKPENIRLRAATAEAVLLDFGIATQSGETGEFSTRAQRHTSGGGTLGYAPDALEERRLPDARSDIHALGMTLYRLVSGRDPLEIDDLLALRQHPPRHFNQQVSPKLESLILRAIAPQAQQRPRDGGAFLRELDVLEAPRITPTIVAEKPPPIATTPPVSLLRFAAGETPRDVRELTALCDHYPAQAQEYLWSGELERWLRDNRHTSLADRAHEVRQRYRQRERALEAFLQATGAVGPPQLRADSCLLDFGTVVSGEKHTLRLHLKNPGRGFLFGELVPSHSCLQTPSEFDGNAANIPVIFDARKLPRGTYSGELTVDSSAGELRIPFRATVKSVGQSARSQVVWWSVAGMIGGCALRTVPLVSHVTLPGWGWLRAASPHLAMWPISPLFGATLFAAIMPFLVAESLRRKNYSTTLALTLFAALLSLFCGLLGLEILIAGDGLLRPYLRDLTHNWAAGGWMFVGGVLGACYGTLRQWNAIFSRRLPQILLGWLTAVALLYGVLAASLLLAPR